MGFLLTYTSYHEAESDIKERSLAKSYDEFESMEAGMQVLQSLLLLILGVCVVQQFVALLLAANIGKRYD
jgi:hypothetical protein